MEVTRAGAGKSRLQLQRVHLEDILTRAAEACRPLAEARRQDLRVLLLPAPTAVSADPDRLHQVVENLLTNAIKYTPEGGQVWLKATVEGDEAVFRVEDTGVGIAAEMLPKIFDLFTQEDVSLEHSRGGLGLGLSVVKELVARHHGTVQVRSKGRDIGKRVYGPVASLARRGAARDDGAVIAAPFPSLVQRHASFHPTPPPEGSGGSPLTGPEA